MAAAAGNLYITLVITETKIELNFLKNQFYLNGYNIPYRHDHDTNTMFVMTLNCI